MNENQAKNLTDNELEKVAGGVLRSAINPHPVCPICKKANTELIEGGFLCNDCNQEFYPNLY